MAGDVPIRVTVLGLNELRGRFAEVAGGALPGIERRLGAKYGAILRDIYREHAPVGLHEFGTQEQHFFQTIRYEQYSLAQGLELRVTTNNTQLRKWLAEGTGIYGPHQSPVVPRAKKALAFRWKGRAWVLKSVKGMPANLWEARAFEEVPAVAEAMGAEIAQMVARALTEE